MIRSYHPDVVQNMLCLALCFIEVEIFKYICHFVFHILFLIESLSKGNAFKLHCIINYATVA